MTVSMRISEAERFLKFVFPGGGFHELRVAGKDGYMRSGRYDDLAKMARHAVRMQVQHGASAVYYTLNSLKAESKHIGAPEPNLMQGSSKRGHSTKDKDVRGRSLYLIDCDPMHESGTMATDERCAAAAALATQVRGYLHSLAWPEPIEVFSGNGAHLIYRGDNCDAASDYWLFVLRALAKKFNTKEAKIDTGVGNPSRIARLPGCSNRKGGGEGRLARVLQYPDKWEPLMHGKIYSLANKLGMGDDEHSISGRATPEAMPELIADEDTVLQIVEEFASVLRFSHVDQRDDATYFVLAECPFAGHRHRGDANKTAIILGESSLGFKCMSDDCADYHWHDLKVLLYERTGRLPSARIYAEVEITDEDVEGWGLTWEEMTPTDEETVDHPREPTEEDTRDENHQVIKGMRRLKENSQWQYDDQTWKVIHATDWSTMPRDADSYGLDAEDLHTALYDASLDRMKSIDSEEEREAFRKNYCEVVDRRDPEEMVKHLDVCDLFWAMRWKHRPNDPEDDRSLTFEEMQRMAEAH